MKRIACCLLAATSWLALPAWGGTRPGYGGTLRVAMAQQLSSLDPREGDPRVEADGLARERILPLLFDTLVRVDAEGRGHPQLAVAWQADRSFKRWQFWLRPGIHFSDGTALTAAAVVAVLSGYAEWTARMDGDSVVVESESPQPGLLAELALARNAVVRRGASGEMFGSGPFLVRSFVAGKSMELVANDRSWGGRPFVDVVEIEFGKNLREQMVAFQLGKLDLIEVGADQLGKVESEGRKAQVSLPVELVALVAAPGGKARDGRMREALSLTIDRKSIQSVLLRGGSETAGGVLPEWMSGIGFLFPVQVDLARARTLVEAAHPALTLSYEGGALGQLLAERVALNAREAGLSVQVVSSGAADLRLKQISLRSGDPVVALRVVGEAVGAHSRADLSSPQELYVAEKKLMEEGGVIPLFYLPLALLPGERVRNFPAERLGAWPLEQVWLDVGEP
jgi:peptide/nickel transport system substrate-binding protein